MSDKKATPPKRKKGGQPGNLNALKHGFYSRHFRKMDLNDLDAMLDNGLDSEVNMLRVSMRRLLEISQENTDLDNGIRLLSVLGNTATRLANLLRVEAMLGGSRKEKAYNQLLAAVETVGRAMFKDE